MKEKKITLANEQSTLNFGADLARLIHSPCIVYLHGELGAGKTTLVRGFLQSLGHQGAVKSPTYTLVEPYQLQGKRIFHFDLYRLGDPEELEYIGVRDYFGEAICLIEWAERGKGFLPTADLDCFIKVLSEGREIDLMARTELGQKIIKGLK